MKLSIIVPVYNVYDYIDKCLESLSKSYFEGLEIIIVNDGTKDNSQEIIDKYTKKFKFMKSFIKENGGLSSARNYGINASSGEYIGFVDSDDYVESSMFKKLYDKAKSNGFDMVVCDLYEDRKGSLKSISSLIKKDLFNKNDIKKAMTNIYPAAWNKIYKRQFFDIVNFKEGVWFEDVEFLYRLIPSLNSIGVVNEALYYYVQREGAITSKVTTKIYDYIDNLNSIVDFYKKNNLFNSYYNELEYVYFRYLYATFIKRVINFEYLEYRKALSAALENVLNAFPKKYRNPMFYKSLKSLYLLLFNKKIGIIMYKIKKKAK